MKLFSEFNKQQINEVCATADVNPGNSLAVGVTNHITPVENIVTNVKNLFVTLPIVVSVAEDGFSIKINSSQFVSRENVDKILYEPVYQNQSLSSYVASQGLSNLKVINLGQFMVVYIGPSDIAAANPGEEPQGCENCACSEMESLGIDEAELVILEAAEDEEEIEELTKKQIYKIIDSKDKVKAAKQFALLIGQQINLPKDYYFAGVKDKDGNESIALRWKYIKRRPHGKSSEVTRSLMNIFGTGDYAVWVGDFDKNANFQIPDEVKKLIESILEFLGAEKTSDSCVYKIKEEKEDKKEEENDDEDDNSRGDSSDENDDK